jgi:hypothetical protein
VDKWQNERPTALNEKPRDWFLALARSISFPAIFLFGSLSGQSFGPQPF